MPPAILPEDAPARGQALAGPQAQHPAPRATRAPAALDQGAGLIEEQRQALATGNRAGARACGSIELDLAKLATGAQQANAQLLPRTPVDKPAVQQLERHRRTPRERDQAEDAVQLAVGILGPMQAHAQLGDRGQGIAAEFAILAAPMAGIERNVQFSCMVLARDGERLGGGEIASVAGQQAELQPHVVRGGGLAALIGEDQLMIVEQPAVAQGEGSLAAMGDGQVDGPRTISRAYHRLQAAPHQHQHQRPHQEAECWYHARDSHGAV